MHARLARIVLAGTLAIGGLLPAVAATGDPPGILEGIRIGESFRSVDRRLSLHSHVPFRLGDAQHYIIDTRVILTEGSQEYLDSRGIRRLELRLRDEKVEWIRVEYRGRDDEMFDTAGEALLHENGPPDQIQNGGPMQVGRAQKVRLYLWLRIWTWEWPGTRFTVEGKHYGDDKTAERASRHRYTYTLDAGPQPEQPDNIVPIRKLPTDAMKDNQK